MLTLTQQLQQWLQWHAGAGKNRSANKKIMDVVDDLIKLNTCIKQLLEIYSKMYYTSWVKPEIPLDSMDTNISMLCQQTERKFKMEPKEIQDEVMRIHKKQITSKNSIAVAKDDEAHLNIDVEVHQRFESYTLHHLRVALICTLYIVTSNNVHPHFNRSSTTCLGRLAGPSPS